MSASRLELLAVAFAGAGTLVATAQAWISYQARHDFIDATRYSETSIGCAELLSAASRFGDAIAGVLVVSNATNTPVVGLSGSPEIDRFRSAKGDLENALYRLSVIAPQSVLDAANVLSTTLDNIHKSAQLDRPAQAEEPMKVISSILEPNRKFSTVCREFIQTGKVLS